MNNLKTYLTEAYAIDDKSILRILTQNKQINTSDPKYNYYKKLADWANSAGRQQKLKNIDLATIELSDRGLIEKNKLASKLTTLGHALLALKNLMDQSGRYDPASAESNLIQKTTLEILAGLSGIKDSSKPQEAQEAPKDEEPDKEPEENPEEENEKHASTAGRDWTAEKAKRLASAKADKKTTSEVLTKFYDDYYSLEYAGVDSPEKDTHGIVTKLKSLDSILIQEFNKLGHNPEVNPLAQFLKILIRLLKEKKSDIFNKLTTNTYGAIHNSFIRGYITGNMLGNYNEKNILFCNDLYSYKGLDIVNYLNLQNQTRAEAKKYASEHSHDPEQLVAKILIQQNQPTDDYQNYREKVDNLLKMDQVVVPGSDEAKLRSAPEISELFRYVFNRAPKQAKKPANAEDSSESKELKEILKEIISKAKTAQTLPDMVRHILDQYSFKPEDSDKVAAAEKWLEEIQYNRNDANIETSSQILSEYTLSDEDLAKLLDASLPGEHKKAKADS